MSLSRAIGEPLLFNVGTSVWSPAAGRRAAAHGRRQGVAPSRIVRLDTLRDFACPRSASRGPSVHLGSDGMMIFTSSGKSGLGLVWSITIGSKC